MTPYLAFALITIPAVLLLSLAAGLWDWMGWE